MMRLRHKILLSAFFLFVLTGYAAFWSAIVWAYGSHVGAHYWDDLKFPAQSASLLGFSDPDWVNVTGDLYVLGFSPTQEEELFYFPQLPHGYAWLSDLKGHVHWMLATADSCNVRWCTSCSWMENGDVLPAQATTCSNVASSGVANKLQVDSLVTYDSLGIESLSAMALCRFYRDSTDALDTCDSADAYYLEYDIHVEHDALGSYLELVKFLSS